jgi:hypothetical protein
VDLLITVGDLTNAVEDLTSQGTFLAFSRLLPMFLQAAFCVFAGIIQMHIVPLTFEITGCLRLRRLSYLQG